MGDLLLHIFNGNSHVHGHSFLSWRSSYSSTQIAAVHGILDAMLRGGRAEVPGRPGYYATGTNNGRVLVATLHAGIDPILMTEAGIRSKSKEQLWIYDNIYPAAMDHPDAMRWLLSWSHSLGWAWVDYERKQRDMSKTPAS